MTMPLVNRNRNIGLYADAISAVWAWWDMVTDPSYALQQELDIWEILQRDPKCYQGIQQRLNDVAGPTWRVFPFNNSKRKQEKFLAAWAEGMLRRIPHFADARKRLAQAVFRGQSTELILGRREFIAPIDECPPQMFFVPTQLKNIDPRRFVIKPERVQRPNGSWAIKGQWYMSVIPTYSQPPASQREDMWMGRYTPVSKQKMEQFIRIVYEDEESRLGFGRGIIDVLYFYHWAKQIVIREGLQGLERWAQGVVIAKVDSDKRDAVGGAASATADTMLEKIAKMRSRHHFVIDKEDDIEFVNGGMEGHQMVNGFLNYIDSCIMGVCTGASLHSANDVGSSGSRASDQVGQDRQNKIVQFDINKVDEDISLDLIRLLVRTNRPQLKKVGELMNLPGLEDAGLPQFRTVAEEVINATEGATVISTLAQAFPGKPLKVRRDELYKKVGLTPPDENDDTMDIGGGGGEGGPGGLDGLSSGMMGGDPNDPEGGGQPGPPEENDSQGPEEDGGLFDHGSPEDHGAMFQEPSPFIEEDPDAFGHGSPDESEDLFSETAEGDPSAPAQSDAPLPSGPQGAGVGSSPPLSRHERALEGKGDMSEGNTTIEEGQELGRGGVIDKKKFNAKEDPVNLTINFNVSPGDGKPNMFKVGMEAKEGDKPAIPGQTVIMTHDAHFEIKDKIEVAPPVVHNHITVPQAPVTPPTPIDVKVENVVHVEPTPVHVDPTPVTINNQNNIEAKPGEVKVTADVKLPERKPREIEFTTDRDGKVNGAKEK